MEIEVKPRAVPKEVDTLLKGLAADLPPAAAAMMLSNIANRATAVLHKLARGQGKREQGPTQLGPLGQSDQRLPRRCAAHGHLPRHRYATVPAGDCGRRPRMSRAQEKVLQTTGAVRPTVGTDLLLCAKRPCRSP